VTEETRTVFHEGLAEIRTSLGEMSALVVEGMARVSRALLEGDLEAADRIISGDDEIDLLALETEEACILILATQQPVAGDLRTLVTNLKMVGEIERSGDLVTNIAKAIFRIQGVDLDPVIRGLVDQMREQAMALFEFAMAAYLDVDGARAAMLGDLDDELDELHDRYIAAIFDSRGSHVLNTQQALQLAVIGRFYERIGDHAVNIGEWVEYLATGEFPEHQGAMRARRRREQGVPGAREAVAGRDPGDAAPGGRPEQSA